MAKKTAVKTSSGGASVPVSFDYSSDALSEIQSFFKRSHKVIVPLTVQEILDEQVAMKLV